MAEPLPPLPNPARHPGDHRWTLLLVPEEGHGKVRQVTVSLRTIRAGIATVGTLVGLLVLAAVIQVLTLPRVLGHDALVGENLALRSRLDTMEQQLGELAPLVTRVRAYDEQLRDLARRQALPGFGPLDADEAVAHQDWIEGLDAEVEARPTEGGREVRAANAQARLAELRVDLDDLGPHLEQLGDMVDALAGARDVLPQIWPVDDPYLTSRFGWRKSPYGPGWRFHGGIDLGQPFGAPIYATNDGIVIFSAWDTHGHGNMVVLDHGRGVTSRYCHASRLLVAEGDEVKAGDVLAQIGSTGVSTGPHLHYELFFDGERVDPLPYLPH